MNTLQGQEAVYGSKHYIIKIINKMKKILLGVLLILISGVSAYIATVINSAMLLWFSMLSIVCFLSGFITIIDDFI